MLLPLQQNNVSGWEMLFCKVLPSPQSAHGQGCAQHNPNSAILKQMTLGGWVKGNVARHQWNWYQASKRSFHSLWTKGGLKSGVSFPSKAGSHTQEPLTPQPAGLSSWCSWVRKLLFQQVPRGCCWSKGLTQGPLPLHHLISPVTPVFAAVLSWSDCSILLHWKDSVVPDLHKIWIC